VKLANYHELQRNQQYQDEANTLKLFEVRLGGTYGARVRRLRHFYKHVTPLESKKNDIIGNKNALEELRVYRAKQINFQGSSGASFN